MTLEMEYILLNCHTYKVRTRKRDDNYHNQKVNSTTYYTHRFEKKEGLGMSRVDNSGPRGSKGKLFKLKRH